MMFPISNTANERYLELVAAQCGEYLRRELQIGLCKRMLFTSKSLEIQYQSFDVPNVYAFPNLRTKGETTKIETSTMGVTSISLKWNAN